MEMKIVSRCMVKPAEPTWNGIIPLSELDQISVITNATQIYFYDKPTQNDWHHSSGDKIVDTLKDSLSRVLVPFYPLAGRLSWVGGSRMRLHCNAMGAELLEAESTMKISDFGDFYSSSHKFEELLVPTDYFGKPIDDLPLVTVQVTRFACGGLSVGVTLSHALADGRTAYHFTEEWARLARGEPQKAAPVIDFRLLKAEDPIINGTTMGKEVDDDDKEDVNYFRKVEKGKGVTPTLVVLTKDEIERLKEVANDDLHRYSRFEVIAAHVWRCACKARELKDDDISSFIFLVDVRGRMDPPLPSNYFGNGVLEVHTSSYVSELISKPLSYACSKIREASKKVTNDYVLEFISNLKKQENVSKYQLIDDRGKAHGPSCGANNLLAASLLNLAVVRGVDFGWGKEIYRGPSIVYGVAGDVTLIPSNKNDGSVVVVVCIEPKEKFQEYMNDDLKAYNNESQVV